MRNLAGHPRQWSWIYWVCCQICTKMIYLPKTSSPLRIGRPQKETSRLTLHFQVAFAVSVSGRVFRYHQSIFPSILESYIFIPQNTTLHGSRLPIFGTCYTELLTPVGCRSKEFGNRTWTNCFDGALAAYVLVGWPDGLWIPHIESEVETWQVPSQSLTWFTWK